MEETYTFGAEIHSKANRAEWETSLNLRPSSQADSFLKVNADLDGYTWAIHQLSANIEAFPLKLHDPLQCSAILDGSLTLKADEVDQYRMMVHSHSEVLSAGLPDGSTVSGAIADASITVITGLDFIPRSATAAIQHATIVYQATQQWEIPAGELYVQYDKDPNALETLDTFWESDVIGSLRLRAAGDLQSASLPVEAEFELSKKNTRFLSLYLPDEFQSYLPQGNITTKGSINFIGEILKDYKIDLSLGEAAGLIPSISYKNAAAEVSLKGNMERFHADLHCAGAVELDLGAGTPFPITVESFEASMEGDPVDQTLDLRVSTLKTDRFQPIQGEYRSLQDCRLESALDLETQFPSLLANLVPQITREIEGMGTINILAQGKPEGITAEITSDDLTLYSFDGDPAFGVQLRNVSAKTGFIQNPNSMIISANISASTPYLSFNGNDMEWAGQQIAILAKYTGGRETQTVCTIHPPGGGEFTYTESPKQPARMEWNNLDLKSFVLPLVNRFALETGGEGEDPIWKASGKMNGWLTVDSIITGEIGLSNTSFDYNGPASALIENASLIIPVSYPLQYESLPRKEVLFSAEKILFAKEKYAQVTHSIPIEATSIILLKHLTLPLFGGNITIDNFRIQNWASSQPQFKGRLTFDQLEMSRISEEIPFMLKQGTLNGMIHTITGGQDRISLEGSIDLNAFSGHIILSDLYMDYPFTDFATAGMSVDVDHLDMEPLAKYYNFGYITGVISGKIHDLQVALPSSDSTDPPLPIAFDLELQSQNKRNETISQETISLFVTVSDISAQADQIVKRKQYKYSGIGLRARLIDGDRLQLYGTLPKEYFLAPSTNIFSDRIGIRLVNDPNKIISFKAFWEWLQKQIHRFE